MTNHASLEGLTANLLPLINFSTHRKRMVH